MSLFQASQAGSGIKVMFEGDHTPMPPLFVGMQIAPENG